MIEVVFSDSACGGLKAAQHYGEGEYRSGAAGVIVGHSDGSNPSEEELQAVLQKAEERMQAEWENAEPMGGNPADVYGFGYGLSVGDISEDIPGEKRRQVLEWLYGIYPFLDKEPAFTEEMMQKGKDVLEEISGRIREGEAVRVWYSNQPDELCGMHWFMAWLGQLNLQRGQVILVQLPDWEPLEDGSIITHSGWGGVKPGDWHRYAAMQREVAPKFCMACAEHWKDLRGENAPLRAVLNGRLASVPETIYDGFIIREIEAEEDEFHEAMVIGRVLGKYSLGIGDAWVAHRIEGMIAAGRLIPVTQPAPGDPIYHRRLKKNHKV